MFVLVAGIFMLCASVLVAFGMLVFRVTVDDMLTESGSVFSAFVGGVGFELGAIRGAVLFDFLGFFFGEFGFGSRLIFGGVEMRFFLAVFLFGFFVGKLNFARGMHFRGFIFFEVRTATEGVGFDVLGRFFVFRFDKFGREGHDLIFAQLRFAANRLRALRNRQFQRRSFVARRICAVSGKRGIVGYADIFVSGDGRGFRFRAGVGEKPAG
jgi:hypothetical protein